VTYENPFPAGLPFHHSARSPSTGASRAHGWVVVIDEPNPFSSVKVVGPFETDHDAYQWVRSHQCPRFWEIGRVWVPDSAAEDLT